MGAAGNIEVCHRKSRKRSHDIFGATGESFQEPGCAKKCLFGDKGIPVQTWKKEETCNFFAHSGEVVAVTSALHGKFHSWHLEMLDMAVAACFPCCVTEKLDRNSSGMWDQTQP